MNKIFILRFFTLLSLVVYGGCTSEPEQNPEPETLDFSGELTNRSDCKTYKNLSSSSCMEYTFDESEHKLTIKHIDAGFNCCPEKIFCDFTLENDIITITESEQSALCDCSCLFDLDMVIDGLEAQVYHIEVVEPYVGDEGNLSFDIDLENTPEGNYCVERTIYPWGF